MIKGTAIRWPLVFISTLIFISPAPGSGKALDTSLIEKEIFRLTNIEREKRSLSSLEYDEKLAGVALIHSRNMVEKNFFSHIDRERRSHAQRIAIHYPEIIGGAGENIAFNHGKTEEAVAKSLMISWMNSPGHRANILNRDYNLIGVGVAEKNGSYYATQKFMSGVVKIPEGVSKNYKYGDEVTLKFEFIGNFKKDDLTVFCRFPDKTARYFVSENRYYSGQAPLTPEWIDEKRFRVTFRLDKGRGTYSFLFGRGGKFYPDGFDVRAE